VVFTSGVRDDFLVTFSGVHLRSPRRLPCYIGMRSLHLDPGTSFLVCHCTTLQDSASCAFPRVGTSLFSWKDSHPYLAGLIAGLGAWALQLTSIHYIRRRWFDVSLFSLTQGDGHQGTSSDDASLGTLSHPMPYATVQHLVLDIRSKGCTMRTDTLMRLCQCVSRNSGTNPCKCLHGIDRKETSRSG
jgi:hypothetical protein